MKPVVTNLAIRTVSETNAREHWSARHRRRKAQRLTAAMVVGAQLRLAGVKAPCAVTMTRCAPSGGLDGDNLVSSLKAVRDGIADALGVDDASPLVTWSYAQRRGRPKQWGVDVVVTPFLEPGKT